jgi:hypothetical protein
MRAAIAAAMLPLAACATLPAEGEEPPVREPANTCNDVLGENYLGQRATAALGSEIAAATHATALRWIPPNSVVTMEYAFGRVSVAYDQDMRITRVTCG